MASVTSLGLHQPTGLQYAIQEGFVPANPTSTSYKWHNRSEARLGTSSFYHDDELLVTPRCVIWSRGGVFRKSYKFDLEKEDVSQALLTSFPSVGPLAGKEKTNPQKKGNTGNRETALVVFLKTQAHVYFLSGTSHVIHLPFEVESAIAAPNGLIIQRKLRLDSLAPASLKFPRVPPNSFVSSQPQPWSAASSIQSTFSIADLGAPKQMPKPQSTLKDMWDPPSLKNDSNWPRLFSLSDPLAELGLVVAASTSSSKRGKRRSSTNFSSLDTAEEILHVSRQEEFSQGRANRSLILAMTVNRETSMYTVWKFAHSGSDSVTNEKHRVPSGAMSRRRSSHMPGTVNGATTPVLNGQQTFRESFIGVPDSQAAKKGSSQDESRDTVPDFAASLDPDFDNAALPRRKSRRVSSMLARADLSASNERSAFLDLATGHQHVPGRRAESLGNQHARVSMGGFAGTNGPSFTHPQNFSNSINSFLEAPVDDLLDELRAGGNFEGFHNMGIDDEEFDALKQEIVLTRVCSVPIEHDNIRYSSQNVPATSQCRIFTLAAPVSAADDTQGNAIVVCVLDSDEKKLLVLTLYAKSHKAGDMPHPKHSDTKEREITVLSLGPVMRAKGVIDACRIDDGLISRILVLTETPDGYGELSLQAPWSVLMKVPLPPKFTTSNIRDLGHNPSLRAKREGGLRRVLSQGPRALRGLLNPKPRGIVDLVDDEGRIHQLEVLLQPRNPHVCKTLELCRAVLPSARGGEGVLVCWWNVMQWLRLESIECQDEEWTSLVITLLALPLSVNVSSKSPSLSTRPRQKTRSGHLRSSSGSQSESWRLLQADENSYGNMTPAWASNTGWNWLDDEASCDSKIRSPGVDSLISLPENDINLFLPKHVKLARTFISTGLGQEVIFSVLPTCGNRVLEVRRAALTDIVVALHLLLEEQKLDITVVDAFSTGKASLAPVVAQIISWVDWPSWKSHYENEDIPLTDIVYDTESPIEIHVPQPFECPTIYQWIQSCIRSRSLIPFTTLPELVTNRSSISKRHAQDHDQWFMLTPKTLIFMQFFADMQVQWSAAQCIEALAIAGADSLFLDTLPEAVLAPLQEAIVQCQTEPPLQWSKDLLALIKREDVTMLLTPGQKPRQSQLTLLAPSHEASLDIRAICTFMNDTETTGSFDGSAEVDRLAVTRSIFKDDRRMNEAIGIFNTSRTTVAYLKPDPLWTESELLEAQKEHAQMLAQRTLAIPAGRGMLYFSARIPLLTQMWQIGGFNLQCIMKPDNNTVAVEKTAFSEDKVNWAFFHAGVASGLSISRDAKGIDTSWILYNKPLPDSNNRHAGFLLALGLNGHLKNVAKWVAFKYLTPKHQMTSIGLLLGLAASYIGTMDSLITRLLSVHVTRMLPSGAAELNLSPLVQTTGVMGIGLLYCNTQHRRMSEIMVSEIEHIDVEADEEPLRNEGYRLAAGFALGFINLGKGSDLKGLHDMRLTERLLSLAASSKKVDLVHVLDKATAAAVIAIALIFMKSENQVLARKIDVPDSLLRFDYVRPDIFLLRTVARHLIMWSQIEASYAWIRDNLPGQYREQYKLQGIIKLSSEDLPFYDILTGLCFSIALRFAGSGSFIVRDLLIYFLDQLMRICRIEANTFDKKLTRNTVRNCQDLLALSVSTVMAGTGDLVVFRRLRSMHGRDDNETPYGSHLAAHLALGALFLGGGTFTFGTSNLAIAALIVAFYPIFPSSIQDNKSHLQAFRHFWVMAAEPRCLVAKDIDTNQPVPVSITITLRNGQQMHKHTPCLLPELDQISTVRTKSSEYWNIVLDFEGNKTHTAAFKATQTIHLRRRPAHDASTSPFQATLVALNEADATTCQSLDWLFELPAFSSLSKAERALVLPSDHGGASDVHAGTDETVVDARLVLENATLDSGKRDRLLGLKLLFEWAEREKSEGIDIQWIRSEVVERLKARVWMVAMEE